MSLTSFDNMHGKKGYVKLAKGIYLFGEIVESDISGASGYIGVVESMSKTGKPIKVVLWEKQELLKAMPFDARCISKK